MRLGPVDRLPREHMDRVTLVGESVVRQVHVEVESRYAREVALLVEVTGLRQWRELPGFRIAQRSQTITILDRDSQSLHQFARVFAKALLPRHQSIAMMVIFHVAHFGIVR